jgi:hypothetical protein
MPQFRIFGPGIVAKSLGAQFTRPAQLVTVELWLLRIGPGKLGLDREPLGV